MVLEWRWRGSWQRGVAGASPAGGADASATDLLIGKIEELVGLVEPLLALGFLDGLGGGFVVEGALTLKGDGIAKLGVGHQGAEAVEEAGA